jgi:hypothetical protein
MRGRAKTEEAENARREKIARAMRGYVARRIREDDGTFGKRRVDAQVRYVVKSRERPRGARRYGWDYFDADPDSPELEYGLVDEDTGEPDLEALREHLNRLHPGRRYWIQ